MRHVQIRFHNPDVVLLRELHSLLWELVRLSSETGLWLDGHDGVIYFDQIALQVKSRIQRDS